MLRCFTTPKDAGPKWREMEMGDLADIIARDRAQLPADRGWKGGYFNVLAC